MFENEDDYYNAMADDRNYADESADSDATEYGEV